MLCVICVQSQYFHLIYVEETFVACDIFVYFLGNDDDIVSQSTKL